MLAWLLPALLLPANIAYWPGPPALPPFPGEREQPVAPPEDAPAKPPPKKKKPAKVGPAGSDPPPVTAPTPDPAPNAGASPPSDKPTWSIPQAEEPPQPNAGQTPDGAEAPAAGGSDAPLAPAEVNAPRIGDDPDAPGGARPPWQIPPPRKPPYRGTGLYIGAGVAFALALAEQIAAHILVKRRCIDPIANGEYDTTEDFGDVVAGCAPGVLPALALRLNADLALLAAIGLTAGGSGTRGTSDAYDDVFGSKPQRQLATFRGAGIGLIGGGLLTWFGTGAGGWAWLGGCGSGKCATRARLFTFLMRDVSAAMVASGVGMLTFAEVYRRRHESFTRDRAFSVGPSVSQSQLGISASGRF